ncbi:type II toxin-antitoxin system PemK/MazF family toxin [Singulisphaera rosea]
MRINRGDIFWVGPGDAGGLTLNHPHPHVVVQEDLFNDSRLTTVIVCGITSNLRRSSEPGNVLLDAGEANLTRPSVVVVGQLLTIQKSGLGERIGSLSNARVQQILDGLRFQQSFFER